MTHEWAADVAKRLGYDHLPLSISRQIIHLFNRGYTPAEAANWLMLWLAAK